MFAEHFFLILAVVMIVGFASYSWNNGVVSMLWGIVGTFGGIFGGVLLYRFVIGGLPLSFGVRFTIAFIAGLIIYLIVRAIAKGILRSWFEPDGPLSFFADGFGGMIMSLVPSLLTIAVLAIGLRIGGTLADLRRYELLATPTRHFLTKQYPKRPLAAQWRDGLENLPGVIEGLDLIEPIGRVAKRRLVALLIISKKPPIQRHLSANLESKPIFESPVFQSVMTNESIQELNKQGDRLALLSHPGIEAAVLDPNLRARLMELDLPRLVDGFLLSPEWQELVEGYKRGPGTDDKLEPIGAGKH